MTNLVEELRAAAKELQDSNPEYQAVEMLKTAGHSEDDAKAYVAQHMMEKEAVNQLTQAGIDVERAVSMVKAAKIDIKSLSTFQAHIEQDPVVEMLLKAASYIEALESKLNAPVQEEVALPETFTKAAQSGALTFEDLEELRKIDTHVLEKIASGFDTPWEMGRGEGTARVKTDPMLDFLTA